MKKIKTYSAEEKAKVALEAINGVWWFPLSRQNFKKKERKFLAFFC